MTISRCLAPFAHKLSTLPKSDWKALVQSQPEQCPGQDCSREANCRKVCAEYARVQWQLLTAKTVHSEYCLCQQCELKRAAK